MVGPPPLTGLKILEFAGLAPGPFAGLLLADAGASVLRIDRASTTPNPPRTSDQLARHKSSIAVDLKNPSGVALIRQLARHADVVIEPFRPGVMEKLGLGPEVLCAANPRLIYARLTGFRREGRYTAMAGHDINYLSVSGVLALLGRKDSKPTPPMNILGDFAGGGAVLFQGILMALFARERSGGWGQVVEANMVDGSGYLASLPRFGLRMPMGCQPRGENVLDSGCPYYDTYETRDGGYMAVGALEPQFYEALIAGLGLKNRGWEQRRYDRVCWPEMRDVFEKTFRSKTRGEWEKIFDGTDACCTPVFEYRELEGNDQKEGDQRPPVTLQDMPLLAVDQKKTNGLSHGQGPGVPGNGYIGQALSPGQGGEEVLQSWLGWEKGKQFEVQKGGLILKSRSKL